LSVIGFLVLAYSNYWEILPSGQLGENNHHKEWYLIQQLSGNVLIKMPIWIKKIGCIWKMKSVVTLLAPNQIESGSVTYTLIPFPILGGSTLKGQSHEKVGEIRA
jgi:hypothetical protein